ncbi:hypothetical protein BASA62_009379 [Batrachochytrium salamandrivorans]|nr:hypothetical protein BASA62_009379 [Batrachochytrium salamandrivorans]
MLEYIDMYRCISVQKKRQFKLDTVKFCAFAALTFVSTTSAYALASPDASPEGKASDFERRFAFYRHLRALMGTSSVKVPFTSSD